MEYLKRVKVLSEELEIGMFVSALDREWEKSSFLLQGFTIKNLEDIEEVKQQCAFVYVDFKNQQEYEQHQLKHPLLEKTEKSLESESIDSGYNLRKKLKPALSRRRTTTRLMKNVLEKILSGEDFDLHGVRDAIKMNVRHILENQDAMLMMTMLKSKSEGIVEHSLNVSILAIGFAKSLGYSNEQLDDIGMAALLHDIGQIKVDSRILFKKGYLNQNERHAINKHCQYGFDILNEKPGLTPSCIDVVLSHHEKLDGSGYPKGLKAEKISKNARIVSVVDIFDSLTSHQSYRKGMSVMDAYKILMDKNINYLDNELVLKFIKWRTIYPIGSIVEMENGEVGIVVKSNKKHRLKPQVLLVLNEYKQPREERLVNMDKMDLDPESHPYKITHAYENMAFGIDLQEYSGKGLNI